MILREKLLDTPDKDIIFESPDHGQTVYARRSGQTDRTLVTSNYMNNMVQENQLWHEIRLAAQTDPILQELLDRVKIYHALTSSNS